MTHFILTMVEVTFLNIIAGTVAFLILMWVIYKRY